MEKHGFCCHIFHLLQVPKVLVSFSLSSSTPIILAMNGMKGDLKVSSGGPSLGLTIWVLNRNAGIKKCSITKLFPHQVQEQLVGSTGLTEPHLTLLSRWIRSFQIGCNVKYGRNHPLKAYLHSTLHHLHSTYHLWIAGINEPLKSFAIFQVTQWLRWHLSAVIQSWTSCS